MYITQGLHRALQQKPQAVAVRFAGRERTYKEFTGRVARLAGALQALGMASATDIAAVLQELIDHLYLLEQSSERLR